jgi:hypothetical protein
MLVPITTFAFRVEFRVVPDVGATTGDLSDPASIVWTVKRLTPLPAGTAETFTYGTDPEATRLSTGVYQLVYTVTAAGTYAVKAQGTLSPEVAEEIQFAVPASLAG